MKSDCIMKWSTWGNQASFFIKLYNTGQYIIIHNQQYEQAYDIHTYTIYDLTCLRFNK